MKKNHPVCPTEDLITLLNLLQRSLAHLLVGHGMQKKRAVYHTTHFHRLIPLLSARQDGSGNRLLGAARNPHHITSRPTTPSHLDPTVTEAMEVGNVNCTSLMLPSFVQQASAHALFLAQVALQATSSAWTLPMN